MKLLLYKLWFIFREHTFYNFLISLICVYFWHKYGQSSLFYIFYLKLFTFGIISFGWYKMRIRHLAFFQNLGISTKRLIVHAIAMDWLITICMLTIISFL